VVVAARVALGGSLSDHGSRCPRKDAAAAVAR
jgi:hypothetical protein